MADENRFAIYISHSWRPRDVDLNLRVWGELADLCELLVDAPEEPGANPPYYINRIEELLRRSDLFLGVLAYRQSPISEPSESNAQLHCSPYSLFEIRLAELTDIPRLILYEHKTGFKPPKVIRPWEMYIAFDRCAQDRLPEQRQWTGVIQPRIQQWKSWTIDHRKPGSYEQSEYALLIGHLPAGSVYQVLENCVGRYELLSCEPGKQTSHEIFRLLNEAGLVIAEFGKQDRIFDQLYAAAHALGLPSIRMLHGACQRV